MGEDRGGDAVQVLRARGQERAALLKGRWVADGWCEADKVVRGKGVDFAAVRAAIFDFGAAYGFVAAGGSVNGPSRLL